MNPQISVVIPAYNHERFIGPAIESVLSQSVQDFEIVIVDDGSTDKTADVIKTYADPRIHYTWQENQDAFNTINRAMKQARGEWISILNSDDVYAPDRFEKMLAFCESENHVAAISNVIPISDDGDEFRDPGFGWNQWHKKNRDVYFELQDIYAAFLHGNFMVTTSNLFMKRDVVEAVGDFCSLRYLHDYDYIFRVMLAFPNQIGYLHDDKLLFYRIHDGNTLSEAAILGREQDLQVIETYMLRKLPEEYRDYVATGSRRLRDLENELHAVRAELNQMQSGPTVVPSLPRRIASRVKRAVFG
ncbi:MAG: glycosyltransferase [Pseudomonadota bacterium]